MENTGTSTGRNGTGAPPWQGRAAMLLMAAVVLYYVAMAWLGGGGFFDHRVFSTTDTSFFRHFGWRMAEGADLYTGLWDTKGPMVYMTYYWGYAVSGGAPWGGEAAILLYSLVATWCAYRAFRCVAAPLPAAAGAVLMSLTVGFIGWCGTTTESTYALWALIGLAPTLQAQGGGGRFGWRWAAAGALVALCVLSKTNYVGFGCFLLAYWAWRRCFLRAALAGAAGFSLVLGAFALGMWLKGNLGAMVDATVLFNLHEYHAAAPAWADFSALPSPMAGVLTLAAAEFQYAKHFLSAYTWMALLFAVSVAVLWWRRKESRALPGLVPALLVWVAAEFATGGVKFLIYDHYYETLFPPICLLALSATSALPRGRAAGVVALLAVAAATSGPWEYFHPIEGDMDAIAGAPYTSTSKGHPIAVLGGTYVLHTMNNLHLRSNQRYLHNAWMLDYELSPARRQELLDELAAALGQAERDGTFLLAEEPLPSLIGRHPDLAPLLQGWRPVEENGGMRVYLYLPPIGE